MDFSENLAGLPAEQSKVYTTLLETGKQTQSDIARHTKINRTTLYPHISELLALGLISQSRVGKRMVYYAEHPNKLQTIMRQRTQALEQVMPQLAATFRKNAHAPKTQVYLGEAGIRQIHHEIADTANYVKTFISPDAFLQVLNYDDDRYFRTKMVEREVPLKGLCSDTKNHRNIMAQFTADSTIQTRFLPKELQFNVEISIFNQVIVFFSWQHRFAVAVHSPEIKAMHEQIFDYFWKISK